MNARARAESTGVPARRAVKRICGSGVSSITGMLEETCGQADKPGCGGGTAGRSGACPTAKEASARARNATIHAVRRDTKDAAMLSRYPASPRLTRRQLAAVQTHGRSARVAVVRRAASPSPDVRYG